MKGCTCDGWGEYHCRDGISWSYAPEDHGHQQYQADPPGEACRCDERCCNTGEDLWDDGWNMGFMPDRNVCTCKWEG